MSDETKKEIDIDAIINNDKLNESIKNMVNKRYEELLNLHLQQPKQTETKQEEQIEIPSIDINF